MATYYVKHPSLPVDAKVHAPSTEKARTTFLDYLERNGRIGRRQRDTLRRNMAANRLRDPESIDAAVDLHYEYEHVPEAPPLELGLDEVPAPTMAEATESVEPVIPTEPPIAERPIIPTRSLRSPIAEVMLRELRR